MGTWSIEVSEIVYHDDKGTIGTEMEHGVVCGSASRPLCRNACRVCANCGNLQGLNVRLLRQGRYVESLGPTFDDQAIASNNLGAVL